MTGRRKWVLGLVGLGVLVLLTVGKHFLNEFGLAFFDAYHGPHTSTAAEAKAKGVWVADFRFDPNVLTAEGKMFEFGEAWLEAVSVPRHTLVWFTSAERAGWSY